MLLKSATMSATVLLIICCAKIFSYALTALQMSTIVAEMILGLTPVFIQCGSMSTAEAALTC